MRGCCRRLLLASFGVGAYFSFSLSQPPQSLSSYFRASLTDLVIKLELTEPSFVRCIAPNTKQKPDVWEPEVGAR